MKSISNSWKSQSTCRPAFSAIRCKSFLNLPSSSPLICSIHDWILMFKRKKRLLSRKNERRTNSLRWSTGKDGIRHAGDKRIEIRDTRTWTSEYGNEIRNVAVERLLMSHVYPIRKEALPRTSIGWRWTSDWIEDPFMAWPSTDRHDDIASLPFSFGYDECLWLIIFNPRSLGWTAFRSRSEAHRCPRRFDLICMN